MLIQKAYLDDTAARKMSVMLSWIAYGLTKDWSTEGRKITPEQLAEQAIAALSAAVREIDGAGLPV
ncbi:hypothetical protein OMP38_27300 [Cohnella ginsengisoli]|uniref:Uncharacterized protein n=1 Tax=Cohnella ginsengisoli TaxID=425004 RepID=A0A9X4KL87_9BACL|nr:hypothetical protein [Cohnella ginsengisoli]MDG0794123.1 hypothetical protein [Cohnella ginsengisoli]